MEKQFIFKRIPFVIYGWLVCVLGAIFYCYEYYLRITPSVMTTELMRTFHLSAVQFGNLVAYYYYIYTPMQLFVGLLMDRYGPKRLLSLACFSCALGACLFAANILWLAYLGRFLIGFGSAFAFVGALKLASIWLPPNRFGFVAGAVTCLGMIGAMIGDATLGHLINVVGWRTTIYISALAGIILMVVLYYFIKDQNTIHHRQQLESTANFKELCRGLWGAMRNINIWYAGVIGCCLFLGVSAFAELWGISYLKTTYSLDSIGAGRLIFMVFLGWAIGSPLMGMLSDWLRLRKSILLLGSILSLIVACLILYLPIWSLNEIYGLFFLLGIFNSVEVLIFAVAREVSDKRITGTALALANMLTMVGGMVFQPMIGKLLDICWDGKMSDGVRVFSTLDYKIALSVLPVSLLLAIVLCIFLKESYPQAVKNA